jgi:hypothetical protein
MEALRPKQTLGVRRKPDVRRAGRAENRMFELAPGANDRSRPIAELANDVFNSPVEERAQMSPIAELTLQARSATGDSFELRVEIGVPRGVTDDEWLCPLSIIPLPQYRSLCDTRGTSAFQALSLAIDYARLSLDTFVAEGGELRLEDEMFAVDWLRLKGS